MQSEFEQANSSLPKKNSSRILQFVLLSLATLALGATAVWVSTCPCERIPGAYLSGERIEEPVTDWTFANQVQLCQIQTRSGILPHALNLGCAADANGDLFLSCGQCEGKRWSTAAMLNPQGYIKLNGLVYPVILRKLDSNSELDNAWRSGVIKLANLRGEPFREIPERPNHWWSFQVTSGD